MSDNGLILLSAFGFSLIMREVLKKVGMVFAQRMVKNEIH